MELDVVFLGTGGAAPSAGRGMPAQLVRHGGTRVLVDCGEGTQRQLMRSVGLTDLDAIVITHGHMDHYLGLPAMLKTFSLRDRTQPLWIGFPEGFERIWKVIQALTGRTTYPLEVLRMEPGDQLSVGELTVEAVPTRHTVPSTGFLVAEHDHPGRFDVDEARRLGVAPGPDFGRLQRGESVTTAEGTIVEPAQVLGDQRAGRRVLVTGDTEACSEVRDAARNADLLVHEATFLAEDAPRARATRHSTALDAALTAQAAQVRMLALTHVSTRYEGRELRAEARDVFPATECPRDFDIITVPLADRGPVELHRSAARPNRRAPGRRADAGGEPSHREDQSTTSTAIGH